MRNILSIDPGNKKCGVLLADIQDSIVISSKIVQKPHVIDLINLWKKNNTFDLVLLGNGTTSKFWEAKFLSNQISPVQLVDETNTTLRAKSRYLELCPPNFLFWWVPNTLILPPKNLDAVVALIFIEDYFDKKLTWPKPIEFKTWP